MSFLLPAGLFGLLALALPLLVHLIRRPPTDAVPFAALRWLGDLARPQRQWRLRQWLLLLLRLLLITALALLLAEPVRMAGTLDERVRAVSPVLPAPAPVQGLRDVWLAEGFPAISDDVPVPPDNQPSSSLLRQLDAELSPGASLQVLVGPMLDGTDGQRPQLSRTVDWHTHAATDAAASAPSDAGKASELPPPHIVLRHDGSQAHTASLRVWQAVASAWQVDADIAALDTSLPTLAADSVLVWLADAALPQAAQAHRQHGGRVVHATPISDTRPALLDNGQGQPLLANTGPGLFQLGLPLDPALVPRVLEADFPARLLGALQPRPQARRADAGDHAPLTGAPALFAPAPQPLAPLVVVLIAVLFLAERLLAQWPRREAA